MRRSANKQEQTSLAIEKSDSGVIRYFRRMPFEWLISHLNNTELVENGYTQRDLALASLVAFHYFDLERAFSGMSKPEQTRLIAYGRFNDGRTAEILVYPGLSDKHFEVVRTFASRERWPLTNRGLFLSLQKEEKEDYDPSLLEAFFMTSDFSTLEMLFNRSEYPVAREELLKVVLEGNWTLLSGFVDQQKKSQDLSSARRQKFLLEYAQNKSKAAAQLLLKTDGNFAVRKLDDVQIMMLLELLDEKTPHAELFALELLKGPRADAIRKLAAERLYAYAGRGIPLQFNYQEALAHFAPEKKQETNVSQDIKAMTISGPIQNKKPGQKLPNNVSLSPPLPSVKKPPVASCSKDFYYTIQEGDSLWKIGRRFGVDIEVLRAFNQLESDVLRPGKTLRIPKKGE